MKSDQSELQEGQKKRTGFSSKNGPIYGSPVAEQRSDSGKWVEEQGAQKHLSTVIRVCEKC